MVVMEEVNVLRHVKGRGNCPEGKCPDPGNPLGATLCDGVDVYADMKRLRWDVLASMTSLYLLVSFVTAAAPRPPLRAGLFCRSSLSELSAPPSSSRPLPHSWISRQYNWLSRFATSRWMNLRFTGRLYSRCRDDAQLDSNYRRLGRSLLQQLKWNLQYWNWKCIMSYSAENWFNFTITVTITIKNLVTRTCVG